jgi:hypothetical protein
VSFSYGGVAVKASDSGSNTTEASYARVFDHPNPSSKYSYAMFYMVNEKDNKRRIRLAESIDGSSWTVDADYVLEPGSEEGGNVSGADLWQFSDQLYIVYHASSGKTYARPIDRTLRQVGTTPILLHKSSGEGYDTGRVASPQVVTSNGKTYLYYEAGERLGAKIAWARTA